jgi:hypothetical protein
MNKAAAVTPSWKRTPLNFGTLSWIGWFRFFGMGHDVVSLSAFMHDSKGSG